MATVGTVSGLVLKGVGGFYYVQTADGLVETTGRGLLKRDGGLLYVGDEVRVAPSDAEPGKGVICSVLPRRNVFVRPPIANVDLFLVVLAPRHPAPNFQLLDRFLIMGELSGMDIVLCLNKCDLASEAELTAIEDIYRGVYPVLRLSGLSGAGLQALRTCIGGRRAALAGASGVGKSTLLNALHPSAGMETGEISRKTQRGRHTTRHVELFALPDGGWIFDTPGFTSFDIGTVEEADLAGCYPEIDRLRGLCRYDDCRHAGEPGCRVRAEVQAGHIHRQRYQSYLDNLQEIRNRKRY